MNIQCTRKLLDMLSALPQPLENANPVLDWHANLLDLQKKKALVFVNNRTRYALVLHGVKKADLKDIGALFRKALPEIWRADGIGQESIDRYMKVLGPVHITASSGHAGVGPIISVTKDLPFFTSHLEPGQLIQIQLSLFLSRYLVTIDKEYIKPREVLLDVLSDLMVAGTDFTDFITVGTGGETADGDSANTSGEPVPAEKPATASTRLAQGAANPRKPAGAVANRVDGFVLRVELPIGKQAVWRQVAVPAKATFHQLHRILQACFNWQDAHLHQFQLLDDNGSIAAELKASPYDDELLEEPATVPRFSERKQLSWFLPSCRQITYLYDFGDDWLHLIQLEQAIEAEAGTLPVCLYGEGDAPPEDVGGEPGFIDFKKTLAASPKSERAQKHKAEVLEWAQSQGWEPFSLDRVNARLEKLRKLKKSR